MLTWGALALRLKGRRREAGRAVSRGHSSLAEAGQGGQPGEVRSLWRGEGPNGRESDTTVSLGGARRQMSTQVELPLESRGEAPRGERSGEALTAAHGTGRSGTDHLMERVVERGNVMGVPRLARNLNQPNRRMRTRMSGGVGGDQRANR